MKTFWDTPVPWPWALPGIAGIIVIIVGSWSLIALSALDNKCAKACYPYVSTLLDNAVCYCARADGYNKYKKEQR